MVKFNPKAAQFYAQTLQEVIQSTQDVAEAVEPFYSKLKPYLNDDKLVELSPAEFAEIKAEFEDAANQYTENANKLAKVQTPVRFMGVQKTLAKHYDLYAKATVQMTESLDLANHQVNQADFDESEATQEAEIDKVQIAISKIMQSTM